MQAPRLSTASNACIPALPPFRHVLVLSRNATTATTARDPPDRARAASQAPQAHVQKTSPLSLPSKNGLLPLARTRTSTRTHTPILVQPVSSRLTCLGNGLGEELNKDGAESDREDMDQAEGVGEYDIEDGDDDLEALAPEALSLALAQAHY
ncbi:hypothetical protein B0H14DRAFT_3423821 [Mycena olivaceomarginata]|nr:hypothetical protein B0H14DRAFT_3423821 [Mycena olivaceomarginata]